MKKLLLIVLIGVGFVGCGHSDTNLDELDEVKISWKEILSTVEEKLLNGDEDIYFLDDSSVKCEYENTSMIGLYKGNIKIHVGQNTFWYDWNPKPLTPFVFENGDLYYMYDSTGIGKPMFQNIEKLKKFEVMKIDVSNYLVHD